MDVKQVVVVRRDLELRRGQLAALVARASMQFLIDNNESLRPDEVHVQLTQSESMWLTGSNTAVLSCNSEDELRDLAMRAALMGVDAYNIDMQCLALGPERSDVLERMCSGLKNL